MHLTIVTTSFPADQAGREAAGSFVADFASELARSVTVTVVAPGAVTTSEQLGEVHVRRFAAPGRPLSTLSPANPLHWGAIVSTLSAGGRALRAVATDHPIDHVLALWVLPSGYWARRLLKSHGIPYSTWALGSDIWTLARIPVVRGVLRRVLRDASHSFADGYELKREVQAISDRSCDFLPSVRNLGATGVKSLRAAPPYRLAFLGRWHRNKGIDLLLTSLRALSPSDWTCVEEVRIAGGGPLESLVRAQAAGLQTEGRPVSLLGYLGKAEAEGLLAWADYLVIPSRIESVPVVFSDAMQAACPVIAMPVGDLPVLLATHQVGFAAADVSTPALTAALQRALRTPPASFTAALRRARPEFSVADACVRLRGFLGF
ncbi:MAG TPA: glycosyltransferase [Acidiferrobacterales bacterium]